MRLSAGTLLAMVSIGTLVAQQERLMVRTFGDNDGLPAEGVRAVFVDEEERVWAGTSIGLLISAGSRFLSAGDFGPFSAYELSDPVTAIADGGPHLDVLIAGEGGLAHAIYRSPLSTFLSNEPVFPDVPPDSLADVTFTSALHTTGGEVVFGTRGRGLWVRSSGYMTRIAFSRIERPNFRNTALMRVLPGRTVTALVERSDGEVWVGTTTGLVRYRSGQWTEPLDGYASLAAVPIAALCDDGRGSVWIGTTRGDVYEAHRFGIRRMTLPSTWRGATIHAIVSTTADDVWVGSNGKGLLRIRRNTVQAFTTADGLSSMSVRSLFADASGQVWLGSDQGLSVVSPEHWFAYSAEDGLPQGGFTSASVSPSGGMLFGGTGVVVRIWNGRVRTIRLPGANGTKQIHGIFEEPSGDVWMLTNDGVVHRTEDGARTHSFDRSWDPSVLQLIRHPSGGVIVRNPHSIVHMTRNSADTLFTSAGGDRVDFVSVARNGDLYAIHRDQPGIVYRIRGKRVEQASVRYPVEFIEDASGAMFLVEPVHGFMRADDLAWTTGRSVGEVDWYAFPRYTNGIIARSGKKFLFSSAYSDAFKGPAIVEMGRRDSLIRTESNAGTPILELSNGLILCYGHRGFGVFDPEERTFALHDHLNQVALGLMKEERIFRALAERASTLLQQRRQVLEDQQGNLWFVHAKGIGMIPRHDRRMRQGPPILPSIRSGEEWYIPAIRPYDGRSYAMINNSDEVRNRAIISFDSTSPVRVRPRTNELVFSVVLPASLRDGSVSVQYVLDPGVSDWSPASTDGTIRLAGLSQGSYRLLVRSVSASGPPSAVRALHFTLEMPFWNSAWFFVLAGVTGLYGAFVAYERRVALLRDRHQRETEDAVQQNELRMARTLQMAMLPKECPIVPGFEIAARMIPASDVGGDFYDFMSGDDETRVVIGDVSGHGLTGAMVVGMARTAVRFATSATTRIARILAVANDRLREDVSKNIFIAMMYGVLYPGRRRFRYVCAGQPTPILVRDGKASFLPTGKGDRFPLGMLIGVRYREESISLRSGDLLLLYTDGIVEAMNAQKEEFGFERLQRALMHLQQASASAVIDGLLASVESYTDRSKQDDDITLIAVKVTDGGAL